MHLGAKAKLCQKNQTRKNCYEANSSAEYFDAPFGPKYSFKKVWLLPPIDHTQNLGLLIWKSGDFSAGTKVLEFILK